MSKERVYRSRYGVYYDLSKSPYEYKSPYGDSFKFRSQKKLDIYTRDIQKEIDRVSKFVAHRDLVNHIPKEIVQLLYRTTYKVLYYHIEG